MDFSALWKASSLLLAIGLGPLAHAQGPVVVSSPDSRIQAELSSAKGALTYRVLVDGQEVIAPSSLGIRSNNVELGSAVSLGAAERRAVHGSFPMYGTHTVATIDAAEATVPVTSHGETYHVDLHVANGGVGVRLRLDARSGRMVQADRSGWTLNGDPEMWVEAWDPGYENFYHATPMTGLDSTPLGLPVTARMGALYVALSEAALKDYGDLAVQPEGDGRLQGKLLNDPDGWTTSDAVVQPWRVTIIARDLTALVNSTLVQELNPAPEADMANAAWVKPGRSTWQWLSSGAPIESEQHRWVDWTQQLGFEYYLVDEGWAEWKTPWPSLIETVAYGKQHHVKTWIWADSSEVKDPAQREEYFRRAVAAGVVGVKIDFPPPTNRWWSTWYWDTARDAAKHHLMVDFHGATKPTGMERTWPNALTREGIRGHEYHITRYHRKLTPEHDTILPFTRFVVGPGDYTPTVFETKELQGNTWAHELAQAIVFTSPFLCYGGNPQDYLANPAKDVLESIPSVWDETRVLPASEPGKIAAFARRSGNRWFVGVLNGGSTADVTLPLSFLGNGSWNAVELFDQPGKLDAWDRKSQRVSGADSIALHLIPRGGFVAEITR